MSSKLKLKPNMINCINTKFEEVIQSFLQKIENINEWRDEYLLTAISTNNIAEGPITPAVKLRNNRVQTAKASLQKSCRPNRVKGGKHKNPYESSSHDTNGLLRSAAILEKSCHTSRTTRRGRFNQSPQESYVSNDVTGAAVANIQDETTVFDRTRKGLRQRRKANQDISNGGNTTAMTSRTIVVPPGTVRTRGMLKKMLTMQSIPNGDLGEEEGNQEETIVTRTVKGHRGRRCANKTSTDSGIDTRGNITSTKAATMATTVSSPPDAMLAVTMVANATSPPETTLAVTMATIVSSPADPTLAITMATTAASPTLGESLPRGIKRALGRKKGAVGRKGKKKKGKIAAVVPEEVLVDDVITFVKGSERRVSFSDATEVTGRKNLVTQMVERSHLLPHIRIDDLNLPTYTDNVVPEGEMSTVRPSYSAEPYTAISEAPTSPAKNTPLPIPESMRSGLGPDRLTPRLPPVESDRVPAVMGIECETLAAPTAKKSRGSRGSDQRPSSRKFAKLGDVANIALKNSRREPNAVVLLADPGFGHKGVGSEAPKVAVSAIPKPNLFPILKQTEDSFIPVSTSHLPLVPSSAAVRTLATPSRALPFCPRTKMTGGIVHGTQLRVGAPRPVYSPLLHTRKAFGLAPPGAGPLKKCSSVHGGLNVLSNLQNSACNTPHHKTGRDMEQALGAKLDVAVLKKERLLREKALHVKKQREGKADRAKELRTKAHNTNRHVDKPTPLLTPVVEATVKLERLLPARLNIRVDPNPNPSDQVVEHEPEPATPKCYAVRGRAKKVVRTAAVTSQVTRISVLQYVMPSAMETEKSLEIFGSVAVAGGNGVKESRSSDGFDKRKVEISAPASPPPLVNEPRPACSAHSPILYSTGSCSPLQKPEEADDLKQLTNASYNDVDKKRTLPRFEPARISTPMMTPAPSTSPSFPPAAPFSDGSGIPQPSTSVYAANYHVSHSIPKSHAHTFEETVDSILFDNTESRTMGTGIPIKPTNSNPNSVKDEDSGKKKMDPFVPLLKLFDPITMSPSPGVYRKASGTVVLPQAQAAAINRNHEPVPSVAASKFQHYKQQTHASKLPYKCSGIANQQMNPNGNYITGVSGKDSSYCNSNTNNHKNDAVVCVNNSFVKAANNSIYSAYKTTKLCPVGIVTNQKNGPNNDSVDVSWQAKPAYNSSILKATTKKASIYGRGPTNDVAKGHVITASSHVIKAPPPDLDRSHTYTESRTPYRTKTIRKSEFRRRSSNYNIDDFRSDDSTDDDSKPRKKKPKWAYGPSLKESIMMMEFGPRVDRGGDIVNESTLFAGAKTTPHESSIFDLGQSSASKSGGRRSQTADPRGSSCVWDTPPAYHRPKPNPRKGS